MRNTTLIIELLTENVPDRCRSTLNSVLRALIETPNHCKADQFFSYIFYCGAEQLEVESVYIERVCATAVLEYCIPTRLLDGLFDRMNKEVPKKEMICHATISGCLHGAAISNEQFTEVAVAGSLGSLLGRFLLISGVGTFSSAKWGSITNNIAHFAKYIERDAFNQFSRGLLGKQDSVRTGLWAQLCNECIQRSLQLIPCPVTQAQMVIGDM